MVHPKVDAFLAYTATVVREWMAEEPDSSEFRDLLAVEELALSLTRAA